MAQAQKSDSSTPAFPKVTRRTAWIYGSIGFPLAILGYPLGSYIPRLYSTEMGIGLAQIGMVIMAAAIFDALTDPLMGHFSDSLKTRWGRRKPWILLGIPFWLFAVWMLLNPEVGVTVFYLAFFFFMMRTCSTLFGLPYAAWGLELSSNYHFRTLIQSAREKYVLAGLMASAILILFSEEIFGRNEASFILHNHALLVVVLLPLATAFVVMKVPEVPTYNAPKVSLSEGASRMLKNKLFTRLIVIELLIAGGENFRNTLSLLFIQDYIGLPTVGRALLLYFGSGLLAIPFWDLLSRRFGKHKSLAAAMVLVGAVSIGVLTVSEGQMAKFYVLFALKGFCFGAFAYLPRAMLADVVDLDTIKSGSARPASYYAILGFMTKCAASFGGLSLPILAWVGYETARGVEHTSEQLMWLGALYGIVPTVVFVFAFYLCITWPLDARMHARVESLLRRKIERQSKRPSAMP